MKLLTYIHEGANRLGVVTSDGVIPVSMRPEDFYARGTAALAEVRAEATGMQTGLLNEADLTLAPVVPNPGKIICVGLNYRKHAAESGMAEPPVPILFSKFNNSLAAAGEQVDYESELVVVMGKTAKHVSEADALDYVLGYCNGNDWSERALQMRTAQWLIGKTPDKFMPIGPYLVTTEDIPDPQNLLVQGWRGTELCQNRSTSDMIFTVAQIIAYASNLMTLSPGDIISTGTPEGVALGQPKESRRFMQIGESYTVEIEGLGRLTNKLVAE
jgi:2-keto-4-pentenoate hydratase/2-oxohepta-3-ene-1,7-dioic acid hydratase in catechol pathway